jgi:hypothetical protein
VTGSGAKKGARGTKEKGVRGEQENKRKKE